MLESKSSNRDSSLDVNASYDLPNSNTMKTVNNFDQIFCMSNKTLWMVFVKKLGQFHDINKKLSHTPFLPFSLCLQYFATFKSIFVGRRVGKPQSVL